MRWRFHSTGIETQRASSIPEKSIAVLPFENFSDNKENSYFAAGIQDDVLTSLAQIHELKVISRNERDGLSKTRRAQYA